MSLVLKYMYLCGLYNIGAIQLPLQQRALCLHYKLNLHFIKVVEDLGSDC
jgi:hypothetical protein